MNTIDANELRNIAELFRQAIDVYISSGDPKNHLLQSFPKGCCTLVSGFLQRYLFDNGVKTFVERGEYRCGNEVDNHEWLITDNGIIIDITGDQYRTRQGRIEYDKPVFVGPIDDFHKLFSIKGKEPYTEPDTNSYVLPVNINNNHDYEEIKRIMIEIKDNNAYKREY